MAQLETVAQLIRRLGAVEPQTTVRLLIETCEALTALGRPSDVTPDSVLVCETPQLKAQVTEVPFSTAPANPGRAQVRAVAALGYELLRGMPPPATPDADAWLGVRPELIALLAPCLTSEGAPTPEALAHHLRTGSRAGTAAYAPKLSDTVVSQRTPAPKKDPRVGELFGAYELLDRLGSGGMGDVYRARHTRLGREVAIKILKPEYAQDAEIVQRFFQEARVVNEINHPHIVQIHDFLEEPGRVYCVMELLTGRSLVEVMAQDGPLPPRRAARLFAQVCDALEAAHRRGVVHRDVKPDNIFVTPGPDGADFARVLDFGVARRLSGTGKTEAGAVLGTLYFMAPEQAAGRQVDARADVYAVGVSLLEALTGTPPSEALATRLPTHTAAGQPLSPELMAVVRACVSLDPEARPQTAEVVRAKLLAVADAPTPPRPSTAALEAAAGLGPAPPRVRLGWAVLGLVVAVTIGVAVSLGAFRGVEATEAPDAGAAAVEAPAVDAGAAPLEVVVAPPPDAGLVTEAPVDAGPPAVAGKARPLKRKPKDVVEPPPPVDPYASRVASVQQQYNELLRRFGNTQLTSLERAAIVQALADHRNGKTTTMASSLSAAEQALDSAQKRLMR